MKKKILRFPVRAWMTNKWNGRYLSLLLRTSTQKYIKKRKKISQNKKIKVCRIIMVGGRSKFDSCFFYVFFYFIIFSSFQVLFIDIISQKSIRGHSKMTPRSCNSWHNLREYFVKCDVAHSNKFKFFIFSNTYFLR